MWQRLDRRKISWDFAVLGRVTRNRLRYMISNSWEVSDGGCHLLDANHVEAEAY
jgi:hypothetical protein